MRRTIVSSSLLFACALHAQKITINWTDRTLSCPATESNRQKSVPVVINRINDVLYTYSVVVTTEPIVPDDFLQLPKVATSAPGAGPEPPGCRLILGQAVDAYNAVQKLIQDDLNLTPKKSGKTYPSVKIDETIAAWHTIAASQDYQTFQTQWKAAPESCKGATGDLSDRLRQVQKEAANLDALRSKVDDSPHAWYGSAALTIGADNKVTTQVTEMYQGEVTQGGNPQPFVCDLKSTVLSISAGTLFSELGSRDYAIVKAPQPRTNGQPSTTTYNALVVQDATSLRPLLIGLLNYDLPLPMGDHGFGFTVSSGPTFRIGGPSNVSSFGYFGGISLHLWKRFFLTPGMNVGEFADFPVGLAPNSPVPDSITAPTAVKRWSARFGFSLTYRTNSISSMGQKDTTPSSTGITDTSKNQKQTKSNKPPAGPPKQK